MGRIGIVGNRVRKLVVVAAGLWMLNALPAGAEERGASAEEGTATQGAKGALRPGGGPAALVGDRPLESTSLEDLLLEKGLITMDDWIRIKAEEERRFSERSVVAEFSGSPRWYERITMYGYGQFRYNPTLSTTKPISDYHDASVGDNKGFFFRRIRWVVTGQVSDHVAFFIQPDLATNINGNPYVLSMRDAFGDWIFDQDKEYRLRFGLQRVPCSFDNWQASRVRMAIDRADSTNSCQQSERDTGISFMWSPKIAQVRFKQMLDYMYGPGDYGVVWLGVYNGQGANQGETNADKHMGARLAWPFELPGGRLMEVGMNAQYGMYNVTMGTAGPVGSTTLFSLNQSGNTAARNYRDERLNWYVYYPPQPWGFIAEYVVGRTPNRNPNGIVETSHLVGGYGQLHYQWKYSDIGLANFYTRYERYVGGLKFVTGAPNDNMYQVEVGVAWQPDPQWEFTFAYDYMHRPNTNIALGQPTATRPGAQFTADANVLRFQIIWFWN